MLAGENGVWQADAWILERRLKSLFGRNEMTVNHTGQVQHAHVHAYVDVSKLPLSRAMQFIEDAAALLEQPIETTAARVEPPAG